VNTKPSCFRNGSCHRAPLHTLVSSAFFYIKTLKKAGASPRLPIRNDHFTFRRSSARKKSHDSSTRRSLPTIAILLNRSTPAGSGTLTLTPPKVSDIDSKRMVIHIQGGKGRVDRRCDAQPKTAGKNCASTAPLGRENPANGCFPGKSLHSVVSRSIPNTSERLQAAPTSGHQRKRYIHTS